MGKKTLNHYEVHVAGLFAKFWLANAYELASNPSLPLPIRIWLLALSRLRNGHSAFRKTEMQGLLGKADGTMFDQRSFQYAIARLKEWGFVGQGSSVRCITIPIEIADYQARAHEGLLCASCGTVDVWSNRFGGELVNLPLVPNDRASWFLRKGPRESRENPSQGSMDHFAGH